MKLKLDENGNAVIKDGKPVYVHNDGQEVAFDAPAAMAKIGELNNEAKTHRLAAKDATEKLKAFEGITDPGAAIKALQFAQSMEGKKAMDDESIKNLISSAVKPIQDELDVYKTKLSEKDAHIYKLEVSNRFSSSAFLKDKTIFGETPDIAEAYFGRHFKIEGGKVVATDANGNQLYSRVRPGEPADFEEAVAILVDTHPKKDHMLKAMGASGSGAQGTADKGTKEKSSVLKRTEFDKLSPADRSEFAKKGGKIED